MFLNIYLTAPANYDTRRGRIRFGDGRYSVRPRNVGCSSYLNCGQKKVPAARLPGRLKSSYRSIRNWRSRVASRQFCRPLNFDSAQNSFFGNRPTSVSGSLNPHMRPPTRPATSPPWARKMLKYCESPSPQWAYGNQRGRVSRRAHT